MTEPIETALTRQPVEPFREYMNGILGTKNADHYIGEANRMGPEFAGMVEALHRPYMGHSWGADAAELLESFIGHVNIGAADIERLDPPPRLRNKWADWIHDQEQEGGLPLDYLDELINMIRRDRMGDGCGNPFRYPANEPDPSESYYLSGWRDAQITVLRDPLSAEPGEFDPIEAGPSTARYFLGWARGAIAAANHRRIINSIEELPPLTYNE